MKLVEYALLQYYFMLRMKYFWWFKQNATITLSCERCASKTNLGVPYKRKRFLTQGKAKNNFCT